MSYRELMVPVCELRAGDTCIPTGQVLTADPSAGIHTPSGKLDVTVRTATGREVLRRWNRRTRIIVAREGR